MIHGRHGSQYMFSNQWTARNLLLCAFMANNVAANDNIESFSRKINLKPWKMSPQSFRTTTCVNQTTVAFLCCHQVGIAGQARVAYEKYFPHRSRICGSMFGNAQAGRFCLPPTGERPSIAIWCLNTELKRFRSSLKPMPLDRFSERNIP
jgi:hypothetical protein